eukprot:scaffold99415_cov27-Tisochrysis_lutea.AAC.1
MCPYIHTAIHEDTHDQLTSYTPKRLFEHCPQSTPVGPGAGAPGVGGGNVGREVRGDAAAPTPGPKVDPGQQVSSSVQQACDTLCVVYVPCAASVEQGLEGDPATHDMSIMCRAQQPCNPLCVGYAHGTKPAHSGQLPAPATQYVRHMRGYCSTSCINVILRQGVQKRADVWRTIMVFGVCRMEMVLDVAGQKGWKSCWQMQRAVAWRSSRNCVWIGIVPQQAALVMMKHAGKSRPDNPGLAGNNQRSGKAMLFPLSSP